ncbi:acid phosphatase like [Lecanosticta acicola]|uniref:Acid phosphatase like n=1 Tax=Lecanosticta acicola TaxID=111012 RepID=A0AAI8Z5Z5_9PEZI|nr:acid phosphatase like [Lecanosticta acicola]
MLAQSLFPFALSYGFLIHPNLATAKHHPGDLRMNQIQVVGTHNSYHREISLAERTVFEKFVPSPENYYYSHSKWTDQLDHQQVRSFEIDLHSDPEGGLYAHPLIWKLSNLTNATVPFNDSSMEKPGLKVFHITDVDTNAICHTFKECLTQLKDWSDKNPHHLPLTFDLELKSDALGCSLGGVCADAAKNWTLTQILDVDKEIQSILPREKLIVPDDVRQPGLTLEQSVLQHGWPKLKQARGKFMFYFDNEPDANPNIRNIYRSGGHESLENRTVFTNGVEGEADAAFIKHNTPNVTEIQRLVKKGYFIRTRADEPITTILTRNTTTRDWAFESAAQIVTTDFPAYGMSARWDRDYAVQLEKGKVARCNPVTAPKWCKDKMLQ